MLAAVLVVAAVLVAVGALYLALRPRPPTANALARALLGNPDKGKACGLQCQGAGRAEVCVAELGMTLPNACLAECAGLPYTPGKCVASPCGCPPIDDVPGRQHVCVPEFDVDVPPCSARCWGLAHADTRCEYLKCGCPDRHDPVCAGGRVYQNSCMAECRSPGTPWTPGVCPDPTPPPRRPVAKRAPPPPAAKPAAAPATAKPVPATAKPVPATAAPVTAGVPVDATAATVVLSAAPTGGAPVPAA